MADIGKAELKKEIQAILKDADLDNTSAKKVRLELQEKLDCDLTERKKEVDQLVMEVIDEQTQEDDEEEEDGSEEEEEEEEEEEPVKKPVKRPAPKPVKKNYNSDDESEEDEVPSDGGGSDYEPDQPVKKAAPKRGGGGAKKKRKGGGSDSDGSSGEEWGAAAKKKKKAAPKKRKNDDSDEDSDYEKPKKKKRGGGKESSRDHIKIKREHVRDPNKGQDRDAKEARRDQGIFETKTEATSRVKSCKLCGKLISTKHMYRHKNRVHAETVKIPCQICGESISAYKMSRHKNRVHAETAKIPCQICGESISPYKMSRHMNSKKHTGFFKFSCSICKYKTNCKWHLNRHMDTHKNKQTLTNKNKKIDTTRSGKVGMKLNLIQDEKQTPGDETLKDYDENSAAPEVITPSNVERRKRKMIASKGSSKPTKKEHLAAPKTVTSSKAGEETVAKPDPIFEEEISGLKKTRSSDHEEGVPQLTEKEKPNKDYNIKENTREVDSAKENMIKEGNASNINIACEEKPKSQKVSVIKENVKEKKVDECKNDYPVAVYESRTGTIPTEKSNKENNGSSVAGLGTIISQEDEKIEEIPRNDFAFEIINWSITTTFSSTSSRSRNSQ